MAYCIAMSSRPTSCWTDPDARGQRRIFLADFGIARPLTEPSDLTATNLTVGTVAYAAPEQLMGEDIDERADEYALAATVFHLLTGAPPYHHSNPVAIISQHLNAPPPTLSSLRPELARLDDVFFTGLAKDPADRFGQCHEFATALSECAGSATSAAAVDTQIAMTPAARALPRRRSRTVLAAAALAVVVLAVVAVVVYMIAANRGPSPPPAPTGAPPSVPTGATPPAAPPPSSVVPTSTPTVTVTATPARPTTTQAASPAELDQQYLNEVTGLWGGRPGKPDAVIRKTATAPVNCWRRTPTRPRPPAGYSRNRRRRARRD